MSSQDGGDNNPGTSALDENPSSSFPVLPPPFDRFENALRVLERERLKLLRDRKGFVLVIGTFVFLSGLCFLSALIGRSPLVAVLGVFLALGGFCAWMFRRSLGPSYQNNLRDLVSQEWFHARFPSAYMVVPDLSASELATAALRGACRFVTKQSVSRSEMECAFLLDNDPVDTYVFVSRESGKLFRSSTKSRYLVWFRRRRSDRDAWVIEHGDWTPVTKNISKEEAAPIFSFRRELAETVKEALIQAGDGSASAAVFAAARARKVKVVWSPVGIWAAVPLEQALFPAPLETSCLDPVSFEKWAADASLPLNQQIRRALSHLASLP